MVRIRVKITLHGCLGLSFSAVASLFELRGLFRVPCLLFGIFSFTFIARLSFPLSPKSVRVVGTLQVRPNGRTVLLF